jgi:hypothetical protein
MVAQGKFEAASGRAEVSIHGGSVVNGHGGC